MPYCCRTDPDTFDLYHSFPYNAPVAVVWWSHVREFCDKVNELEPAALENLRTVIPLEAPAPPKSQDSFFENERFDEALFGPERIELSDGMRPGARALAMLK